MLSFSSDVDSIDAGASTARVRRRCCVFAAILSSRASCRRTTLQMSEILSLIIAVSHARSYII